MTEITRRKGRTNMVEVNGKEIDWTPFPKGWFLTDVKYHILWKNEETGATFMLVNVPKGGIFELPHTHPQADQMGFALSGEGLRNGKPMKFGEGLYTFGYRPKWMVHGPPKGTTMKITKAGVILQYFNGPPTKRNEGETKEVTLD